MNICVKRLPGCKERDTERDQFERVIVDFRISIVAIIVSLNANRTERRELVRRHADGRDIAWATG